MLREERERVERETGKKGFFAEIGKGDKIQRMMMMVVVVMSIF